MLQPIQRLVLLSLLALTTTACSLLPASDPVQSWTPAPAPVTTDTAVQLSDLRVLRPQAQDLLNGNHMLVVPQGRPVSVYKNARWSAPIPNLWRDHLVDALQRDSRFARISSDEIRVAARYELVSRLDRFQTEYPEGQPVVVIRGYLQLVDASSRAIIAERALELSRPADSAEVSAVVEAFSVLMAQSAEEVRDWLLAAGTQAVEAAR
ncbi:MAG: hypothetical protein GYB41_09855 [Oceanospirillales bacterium]|nr:hypothetical protein [Oceanospirillales bacterium]